jgi:membrane carboxypeptidase/penicillin-binding protein
LADVINRGTGYGVREMGYDDPAAGKTGTSDESKDAWFIGYTPELLCGVWMGYDIPQSMEGLSSHIALPVWVRFMLAARRHLKGESFPVSEDLVQITIDPVTGHRAYAHCPEKKSELYIIGTEPMSYCSLHNQFYYKISPEPSRKITE